jgi:hypothetical protein
VASSPQHVPGYEDIRQNNLDQLVQKVIINIQRKKGFSIFPSPARVSLTKLSLGGNNLYMTSLLPPRGEFGKCNIPAEDGNIEKLFVRCTHHVIPTLTVAGICYLGDKPHSPNLSDLAECVILCTSWLQSP